MTMAEGRLGRQMDRGSPSPEVRTCSRCFHPGPYRSKPGDRYVYENVNYMLLALVMEETTRMSVAAALRSSVLADPRLSSLVYQPEERPKGPLALPFLEGQVRPNIMKVGGGYLPTKADTSVTNGYGCMASDSGQLAL